MLDELTKEIDFFIEDYEKIKLEHTALINQKKHWMKERSALIQKNQQAADKVRSLLLHLKTLNIANDS